jgi:DNA-binding NtrC family response regulator
MDKNVNILILEDNTDDAALLQHELQKSGRPFSAKVVQTKAAYEKALKAFVPDIILSDYSLPAFDAVSAFKMKETTDPDIPFIIVSGVIGEENAVELIKSGVTDYVLKDRLYSLNQKITRALVERDEKIQKRISDEKLRLQNQKLFEIAFLQAHQVRSPITIVLGWIHLFNANDPSDPINAEVIKNLQKTTLEFDGIIRRIVEKTDEIRAMS